MTILGVSSKKWGPVITLKLICALTLLMTCGMAESLREPAVQGSFYPENPKELSATIDALLSKIPAHRIDAKVPVLIVPHAGYVYSGSTAAHVYRSLMGSSFETVVLIGPSHHVDIEGASIWTSGAWKTPLGVVHVDETLAQAIAAEGPSFRASLRAHVKEHSLEVQVPFIQRALPAAKIVPIVLNDPSEVLCKKLAASIVKNIGDRKVIIIASTDLSHFHTGPAAKVIDGRTLGFISKLDTEGLRRAMAEGKAELCGGAAVLTALEIAKSLKLNESEIFNYTHSGEVTGDDSRVVGYAAVSFYQGTAAGLDSRDKKELLALARQTVETHAISGEEASFSSSDPDLNAKRAAFVTLKKDGQLRGCIGTFSADRPLYETVQRMALSSASEDPRFAPVTAGELKDLKYEISVLSESRRVGDASAIDYPRQGVILKQGHRSGVFLPKVALETGWTKEEFLSELCSQKAELPADCWKDSRTEITVFDAEDFSE